MPTEIELTSDIQGVLITPSRLSGWGVVVLTGSSGRVDVERARLFAGAGAVALAMRWWGGPGQTPGVNEVPLELFIRAIDRLREEGCSKIAILGSSYGAEAALLVAVRDPRIDLVIAISPTSVVWQNFGPGVDGSAWPPRSSFSWEGASLPFIVWDPRVWPPFGTKDPVFRPMHELSLKTFASDVPSATIPVELTSADIILVAGCADALWQSDDAAREIASRLARHGKRATVFTHRDAGHEPVFPGEPQLTASPERAWGGTPEADRELGAAAWSEIVHRIA